MASANPTQHVLFRQYRSGSKNGDDPPDKPGVAAKEERAATNASIFGPRNASLASTIKPGSFSSNLTITSAPRSARPDLSAHLSHNGVRGEGDNASERRQAEYRDQISREMKIKEGSENMLDALLSKAPKQNKDQRQKVEMTLSSTNRKIAELRSLLADEIERSKRPSTPEMPAPFSARFAGSPLKTPLSEDQPELPEDADEVEESPTFVLGELLNSLETEGMSPDYYVVRANTVVDLFKRHPTLKYDLSWPIFGLRVQTMLLSDSREVIASGYRITRHAIANLKSLRTIKTLGLDTLVVVSLGRDNKAAIEREQALKFARAFLDVKDGVSELSNAVIRAVVSVAEHYEDRLRNIAILTLVEVMVRRPEAAVLAGALAPLTDALRDGIYQGSEAIVSALLHVADSPELRKNLSSSSELLGPFSAFTDTIVGHVHEERLKTNAKAVVSLINSWPGLFVLSSSGFSSVSSLVLALFSPSPAVRSLVLDLLFSILHIKPPSWTWSFLAGRRLTTYGRVKFQDPREQRDPKVDNEDDQNRANLVDHYTALVLTILVRCNIVSLLSQFLKQAEDDAERRKANLLLGEVLKLADTILPSSINDQLQLLPSLLYVPTASPTVLDDDGQKLSSNLIFSIDSMNRTIQRSGPTGKPVDLPVLHDLERPSTPKGSTAKTKMSVEMDEHAFKQVLLQSEVVSSPKYLKWKWDVILDIIEGPLQNPKRIEEAIKNTKFLKRLMAFYRPFKYRFSEARNTKPNQRYVKVGAALMKSLLQTQEGAQYLAENKMLRQLAECLAQLDRMSGITASAPLFSPERMEDTLVGGYFSLLGALSSESRGLVMLTRWRIINMFYHILDLRDRDDVVQALLGSMDFTLDSHLRVMLSKALTSSTKKNRIFATKQLRKYATGNFAAPTPVILTNAAHWAIRLLVTQLYDPDVEVSEVAVSILQEACNKKQYLEYVVRCRPALDHLGEIGAPLLLRFLSTSLGYEYLNGLDYITQEMDDWFLGRNEKYVTIVEASLNKALTREPERPKSTADDSPERDLLGIVPPHFYRELTRTREGCKLLERSGHFEDFVSTIKDFWQVDDDAETMLKVKGCLWAIGNVGSMELGAPFLESSNVIKWIIKIVASSTIMTMRGTAFFVLGLISRSLHGMEILAEQGWDAATNELGQSLGYVLPPSLDILFDMPPPKRPSRAPLAAVSLSSLPPPSSDDPLESRLLTSLVESGNTVLSRRALNDLNAIKAKKPELFESVQIFQKMLHIFECHTVRLPVRQRVFEMFGKNVLRKAVFGEEEDSEEGGEVSMPATASTARPGTARFMGPGGASAQGSPRK